MNRVGKLVLAAAIGWGIASAGAAGAQANQTAEGAQDFLSQLVQGGRASIEGKLHAKVPYRASGTLSTDTGKKDWYGFVKFSEQPASYDTYAPGTFDANRFSAEGACISAIAGMAYRAGNFYESEVAEKLRPTRSGMGDAVMQLGAGAPSQLRIDWSLVRVDRLNTGDGILVSWADPTYKTVWIMLKTSQGTEMVDRMEYAGKFLQASCDSAANTGF